MSRRPAVSLVEVILAIAVIGILAALAVPRLTRAAQPRTDGPVLLRGQLRVLRVAIERYHQDHNAFPGQYGDGRSPAASAAAFVAQLTGSTDDAGQVAAAPDATHRHGPYLRDGVPGCAVTPAALRGIHIVTGKTRPAYTPEAPTAGWVYNCETGQIACNSAGSDDAGRPFAAY